MLFNSPQFALFFLLSVTILFSLPHRLRWIFLLATGYFFYMYWKIEYGLILAGATLATYLLSRKIAASTSEKVRRGSLIACLGINLGALFFFKYFNFFSSSLSDVLHLFAVDAHAPMLNFILPIGISFYTFQATGYVMDVYRCRLEPEHHFGHFALFVAFWPQLLAGPISRGGELLPQLKTAHEFSYNRVVEGLRLILFGMFKKVVIADSLAIYVSAVYSHPESYRGLPLLVAAAFYTVQIYADFSGYTDMARGAAKVMGIELPENFRRPYFATSLREFWQRWHISLSCWFRDYLYIPLGGRRVSTLRWYVNLVITFLLSGLWHGAAWTFIVWGSLHGIFLVIEYATSFQQRIADRLCAILPSGTTGQSQHTVLLNKAIQAFITLAMVSFAWIFFRAASLHDAVYVISHLFTIDFSGSAKGIFSVVNPGHMLLCIALIALLFQVDLLERKERLYRLMHRLPLWLRWGTYSAAAWSVLIATVFGVKQEFIYFQF